MQVRGILCEQSEVSGARAITAVGGGVFTADIGAAVSTQSLRSLLPETDGDLSRYLLGFADPRGRGGSEHAAENREGGRLL